MRQSSRAHRLVHRYWAVFVSVKYNASIQVKQKINFVSFVSLATLRFLLLEKSSWLATKADPSI